jgi:hypothetical protein
MMEFRMHVDDALVYGTEPISKIIDREDSMLNTKLAFIVSTTPFIGTPLLGVILKSVFE